MKVYQFNMTNNRILYELEVERKNKETNKRGQIVYVDHIIHIHTLTHTNT